MYTHTYAHAQKPEEPKKPWGNENPYRIFGVNEEAPYEEVERAFKELVEENEGNEKYIMQLEMMKEDIFDQRLRARMSGSLKSRVKESPFDAKLQVRKVPFIEKINIFEKFNIKIVSPEKKFALQVCGLMAVFIALGLASPQLAPTTIAFGFLSAVGIVYNRGTPKMAGPELRAGGGGGSYSGTCARVFACACVRVLAHVDSGTCAPTCIHVCMRAYIHAVTCNTYAHMKRFHACTCNDAHTRANTHTHSIRQGHRAVHGDGGHRDRIGQLPAGDCAAAARAGGRCPGSHVCQRVPGVRRQLLPSAVRRMKPPSMSVCVR